MATRALLPILKAGFCRNASGIINAYPIKARGNSKPLPFFNQTCNSIRSDNERLNWERDCELEAWSLWIRLNKLSRSIKSIDARQIFNVSSFANQLPHNKLLINLKRSVSTERSHTSVLMNTFFFCSYILRNSENTSKLAIEQQAMLKTRLKTGKNLGIRKKRIF